MDTATAELEQPTHTDADRCFNAIYSLRQHAVALMASTKHEGAHGLAAHVLASYDCLEGFIAKHSDG